MRDASVSPCAWDVDGGGICDRWNLVAPVVMDPPIYAVFMRLCLLELSCSGRHKPLQRNRSSIPDRFGYRPIAFLLVSLSMRDASVSPCGLVPGGGFVSAGT